jgi:ribosomal protein L37AE/L43A
VEHSITDLRVRCNHHGEYFGDVRQWKDGLWHCSECGRVLEVEVKASGDSTETKEI